MIAYLRGKVRRAAADQVVLETGGVGYLVSIPLSVRQQVPPSGHELELHVHTHVREDQLALFGFSSPEELELFQMLIQVDGVGPKVGLSILSAASMEVLKRAILAEDVAPIRRAQGVGPRTAQKVIIGRVWQAWPTKVRVTVGSQEDMARFKAAFKKVWG